MSTKHNSKAWSLGLIKKALRKFEGQPFRNNMNAEKAEYCWGW